MDSEDMAGLIGDVLTDAVDAWRQDEGEPATLFVSKHGDHFRVTVEPCTASDAYGEDWEDE